MATTRKLSMREFILEFLPKKTDKWICRSLGIPNIWEGHLQDTTTIVEVNSKNQVMTVNGKRVSPVPLESTEELEVEGEPEAEEAEEEVTEA